MRKRKGLLALAAAVLLAGCTAAPRAAEELAPKEEQKLVIYTSHKQEVWLPIVTEFENRTGIFVQVVTGGTNELLARIAAEASSPRADVMFGGGVESLESYGSCFAPYTCAESGYIDSRYRGEKDLWTPFSSLPVVLIYNTKLVSPQEIIGWKDLSNPRFRGRIAFTDPAISGSCFTALVTYTLAVGGSREAAIADFAGFLQGKQLDSSADVLTSVANGSNLVGITLEETALKRIAAGDDIAMVYPADGTSCVPDGSALIKNAPHGENARLFLDFVSGRDVQQMLAQRFCRRPVRRDVTEGTELVPLSSVALVPYDISGASRDRSAILSVWAFQFGGEAGT